MSLLNTSVKVSVNGITYSVRAGQNLLSVLKEIRIDIPSACYFSKIRKNGWCGLCLVEIDECDNLQTACTVQITGGMKIRTDSPEIVQARKENLELLFKKHYKESVCAECIWDGECDLHILAGQFGLDI